MFYLDWILYSKPNKRPLLPEKVQDIPEPRKSEFRRFLRWFSWYKSIFASFICKTGMNLFTSFLYILSFTQKVFFTVVLYPIVSSRIYWGPNERIGLLNNWITNLYTCKAFTCNSVNLKESKILIFNTF